MNIVEVLNTIKQNFVDHIIEIDNIQSEVREIATQKMSEYGECSRMNSFFNMDYFDIETNRRETLGSREYTLQDLKLNTELHQNRQYQWLLAEAYEAFEDFLDEIYAIIGYQDHGFWRANEFGTVSINDLKDKDLDWFRERVKSIRDRPRSILNQLRSNIPKFKKLESNNPNQIDYSIIINLVSKLRHLIVHEKGVVKSLKALTEKILKDDGIPQNSKKAKEYQDHLNYYLGEYHSTQIVLLLEIYKENKGSPFTAFESRLSFLLELLAAYAVFIHNSCQRHINSVN